MLSQFSARLFPLRYTETYEKDRVWSYIQKENTSENLFIESLLGIYSLLCTSKVKDCRWQAFNVYPNDIFWNTIKP